MQSDDNQPRQDDESSQVEHTNGLYIVHMCRILLLYLHMYLYGTLILITYSNL